MRWGKCNLQQKGFITRCVARLLSMPYDSASSERRDTHGVSSHRDLRRTSGEVPGNLVSINRHFFIRRRQRKVKQKLTFATREIWGPPLPTQEEVFRKHQAEQRKLPAKQRKRQKATPAWVVEAREDVNKLEDFVLANSDYVADICEVAEFLDAQGALPFVTKKRARMVKGMMELADANRHSCIAQNIMEHERHEARVRWFGHRFLNTPVPGAEAQFDCTVNRHHRVEHDNRSQRLLDRARRYLGKRKLTFRASSRRKA